MRQRQARMVRAGLSVATALIAACSGTSDGDVLQITRPDSADNVPGLPGKPNGPPEVSSVVVTLDSTSLAKGHTSLAHAIAKDASGNVLAGRTFLWSSSDSAVAAVASGVVTARRPGSATISARADDVAGTATVTVSAK
jgi:hypothetical protein